MSCWLRCKVESLPFCTLAFHQVTQRKVFFLADMKFRRNWIDGNDLAYLKVEDLFCTNYYMSSFLMPEKVIVIIERIMKSFF